MRFIIILVILIINNPAFANEYYTTKINSEADWNKISSRPQSQITARTEVSKFIFDTYNDWKLYFIDTNKTKIHYDFVKNYIDKDYDHRKFNEKEYGEDDRRFVMGSIVHYMDANEWLMEIVARDNMPARLLKKSYNDLIKATYFGNKLKFRPQSLLHEQRIKELNNDIPIITQEDFNEIVKLQTNTLGITYGYLKLLKGKIIYDEIDKKDILVTDKVPEDLPICAGLITSKMQTPLSHISILLENRGTPNMALFNAINNKKINELEGKLVKLEITAQDYKISKASIKEATKHWNKAITSEVKIPKLNDRNVGIKNICDFDLNNMGAVGGKAAHLGTMCKYEKLLNIPKGFVIPIYYYMQNFDQNNKMKAKLKKDFLETIKANIKKLNSKKIILRSSTNAEDIEGFSGAGLYSSKIINADADDDELEQAILGIWASLHNKRAIDERNYYNIAEDKVAMAIIIQEFVQNVKANGVAITSNPFFARRPGYLINSQTMDANITDANGKNTPEALLIYNYDNMLEPVLLSRSNLFKNKAILSDVAIKNLMRDLKIIDNHFLSKTDKKEGKAMDVEFLVNEDDTIVILQARPYLVKFRSK